MLLETKNIVQFSLLFGSTWLTNSFVFAGLLTLVLFAIVIVNQFGLRLNLKSLYVLLFGFIVIGFVFPQQQLLNLEFFPRLASAVLLNFSPVFIANIIFAKLFSHTQRAAAAYGVNILGSFMGGIFEYGSMAMGYSALMIFVGIFYLVSLISAWKKS